MSRRISIPLEEQATLDIDDMRELLRDTSFGKAELEVKEKPNTKNSESNLISDWVLVRDSSTPLALFLDPLTPPAHQPKPGTIRNARDRPPWKILHHFRLALFSETAFIYNKVTLTCSWMLLGFERGI